MKQAVNYVRGSICVEVECPYPERFVNVCAQNGIEFWRLSRVSPTVVTAYMHIGGYRALKALAGRAGFSIKPVIKKGVPFFLWRIRKRYVLLVGMLVSILAVHCMSLFVWEMRVIGNEKVSSRLILDKLSEFGVGIGSFGPGITTWGIADDMLLAIPELSWIAVNVSGSRAEVLVRERIPKPEIVDEDLSVMIYAEKSGVIAKMSVLEGRKICAEGDTVEMGDVLVSGILDSLSGDRRTVHAMAEVYARTWYEMSAQMPLEAVIKESTGEVKEKKSLVVAGKKINLFVNGRISWPYYDKITDESELRLPTGNTLPVSLVTERYSEYVPLRTGLSVSDAEKILKERLLDNLKEEIGDGGISSALFETREQDGVVTVTLRAECIESIAAEREFTDEEFYEANIRSDDDASDN